MRRVTWLVAFVVACGGASRGSQTQSVVICPAGSILDPQKQVCVAMEPAKPVSTVDTTNGGDLATSNGAVTVSVATATTVTPPPPPPPPPPPLPPTTGFAIDVRCTFPQGWVALLPASKYPKDDQFLMQSLIGLTKEPAFWNGLPEYRAFQPYAAKRCTATGTTRLLAPTAGDYYVLGGQEGTFSLRGTYDKNGVRRKITVSASQVITLVPADLTMTWVCISCPWIVFRAEGGRDVPPFVILENRRGKAARGTDVRSVTHVPVVSGSVTLRVMEVEDEETHLDALVIRVAGYVLTPDARPALELGPHTQATLSYAVPGATSGFVDVEVEATGYYDPR